MSYQPKEKAGILIYQLSSPQEASQFAYTLLRDNITKQTLLLLGGNSGLSHLHKLISAFETITPGAVAMTDEVFGEPFHYKSKEAQMKATKIIDHFSRRGVPFFRILSRAASAEGNTRLYENQLLQLLDEYSHKIAVLSLEERGRVLGIHPNTNNWTNPIFSLDPSSLVHTYHDPTLKRDHSQRISLTPAALKDVDVFLVLALGEEKKETLKKLFTLDKRQLTRFPAVLLQNRSNAKVHLITDQKV